MKNYFLLILILSVFLSSCKKPNITDRSYTLEEYRELGMPEYDSLWNYEDYETVFLVLNTLKYKTPYVLPVKDSEKSGILFSRIVNIENLSFLQDETLPLHEKAQIIKGWFGVYRGLYLVYANAQMKRQYYIRELTDIDIFAVRLAQKMLDLGNEINNSNDPSDVAMQSGYPSIQKMYIDLLTEILVKQQHTSLYPKQTLELLSDSISNSVKRNMGWFDEDASAIIKQEMLTVIDSTSSQKINNNYKDLIELL